MQLACASNMRSCGILDNVKLPVVDTTVITLCNVLPAGDVKVLFVLLDNSAPTCDGFTGLLACNVEVLFVVIDETAPTCVGCIVLPAGDVKVPLVVFDNSAPSCVVYIVLLAGNVDVPLI